MIEQTFKSGIFKVELKNRFLCVVEVDGEDTLCYIPASCRISSFIDLTQREVLLSPVISHNARTKYSVYALSDRNGFILLNLSKANEAVANNLRSKRFSFLGKREHIRKEHNVDGYKSDIYIEDTCTIVEIKSILSFAKDKNAIFPSVYSQRAIDQLRSLNNLMEAGYNVCYIFVSLNSNIKQLALNIEAKEYRETFKRCVKKGMKVKGVSIKLINGNPIIHSSLPVIV